jgi:Asp-tRNA(Asn)/Glu-tRNA(Gln) amidotransferase A subunit family amidase
LTIGYFKTQRICEASLANQRAVEEAVEALRKKGHKVKEIEVKDFEEGLFRFF